MDADIIVNAANAQVLPGGGVDAVIRGACGPRFINETMEKIRIAQPNKELLPAQVVATDAFLLKKCKKISHSAAPLIQRIRQPMQNQRQHLRLCYYNSLSLVEEESSFDSGYSYVQLPGEKGIKTITIQTTTRRVGTSKTD